MLKAEDCNSILFQFNVKGGELNFFVNSFYVKTGDLIFIFCFNLMLKAED